MADQEFPQTIFSDPARAQRHLKMLHEEFISSGSTYPLDQFSGSLRAHLLVSPDPDMVLTNLIRYAEASVSKASLFNDFLHYPVIAELLVRIFGFSQYFADIIVRDPGIFRWVTTTDILSEPIHREYLRAETDRIMKTFSSPERRLDALKRSFRRELLRIGAQDILGTADLPSVTEQLSLLADAMVDAALCVAIGQLTTRFPVAPQTPFAIIGLGKLGGGELNYSSDIDVMFVYGEDGGESGRENGERKTGVRRAPYSSHEYFNKLAEKVVQNLSQPTAEGHLYRVDTRLRPESGAGPLARSLRSTLMYYESRGELWERQMLIKGRPVAGDMEFGHEFLRQLQPFVHPRTLSQHPAEYVSRIKARIEASVGDETNIKLMSGGIRDVEFTAQTLQLVNAGQHPGLREGNTLRALEALGAGGFLSSSEARALSVAYTFYRTLEHRLQTMLNLQTHTVPKDARTLTALARRLGLGSAEELGSALQTHLAAVRTVFDQVLTVKTAPGESGILAVIEGGVNDEQVAKILASLGFQDHRPVLRNIRVLSSGSSLTGGGDHDGRTKEAFREVAPDLFREISQTPVPELTLANLTALIAAQRLPHLFYTQLADREFRKFLLDICKTSPRLTRGLSRSPLLLETLASDIESLRESAAAGLPATGDLQEFKSAQELRSGIRYLLGFSDFRGLTEELSRLADFILSSVLREEARKLRFRSEPLAVLALGKFGTRELIFDADLDLLFVAGSGSSGKTDRLETLASNVLRRLSAHSERGRLYEADARLRPEGKSAPLVVVSSSYSRYLHDRASLWERQSLTRIRLVCGDAEAAASVLAEVEAFVYSSPLPPGWVEAIVTMRKRMETRSRLRGPEPTDVKLGAGGMADIEFLVQMLQLLLGGEMPGVRGKRVEEFLALPPDRFLTSAERAFLVEAYRLYRRVETLMRLTLEERGSMLPEGKNLEILARCLDGSAGETLKKRVRDSMSAVRVLFLTATRRMAT